LNARTRIKICGITNMEDAMAAVEFGADALGFNFVPDSPRYVGRNPELHAMLHALPPFVSAVGVWTHISEAIQFHDTVIDTIQYYKQSASAVDVSEPDASQQTVASDTWLSRKRMVRAFRIRDEASLEEIEREIAHLRPHALLLDAYHPHMLGGSGKTFNWELAVEAKRRFSLPVVLAGGLTPDNVGEAVRAVRPYAVDVASGVEAQPGRKDHPRLRAFIEAVRKAD
jgi:phosphoribosylanthranilate isomerase